MGKVSIGQDVRPPNLLEKEGKRIDLCLRTVLVDAYGSHLRKEL